MIEAITSLYFDGKDNGIILDDAYDLYKKNQYVKYVNENSINYLRCQDVDMNLLVFFPDIEFITVPEDAENINAIYNLKKLKGLEISTKNFNKLDLSRLDNLEYLVLYDYSKKCQELQSCKNLKHLVIVHSNITDLNCISANCNLESLHLNFCYGLRSLTGIQSFSNLSKLELEYCLKLEDISEVTSLGNSIKYLSITDCNRVKELYSSLSKLLMLETLYLTSFQTSKVNSLPSIDFIENLLKIKKFMTDYKILDGDLTALLTVEEVDILKFYRQYNLKKELFEK